jgi:ferredoxin
MTLFTPRVLAGEDFQSLLDAIAELGYQAIGPTERSGAIEYAPVSSVAEFPLGLVDSAGPGTYALDRSDRPTVFGYVAAAQSWKRYLFPPREHLITISSANGAPVYRSVVPPAPRYAFIGVRACELAAIAIQDRVFLDERYADPRYAARRRDLLLVAVECVRAGETCFCASMGTGPGVTAGADLTLTEVTGADEHWFLVRAGTIVGERLVDALPTTAADDAHVTECERRVAAAAAAMGRELETADIHDVLVENPSHPRWSEVAERCLACTNCTLVCPTCFCSTTADASGLDGLSFSRERRWDSCFTLDFSSLHGHPLRGSIAARYRQWLTHKLANWIDQFGTSGCVGCGRCITWCPAGIDITQEVAAIRDSLEVAT